MHFVLCIVIVNPNCINLIFFQGEDKLKASYEVNCNEVVNDSVYNWFMDLSDVKLGRGQRSVAWARYKAWLLAYHASVSEPKYVEVIESDGYT